MKACCFFGHARYNYLKYKKYIKDIIVELIEKYGVRQFYSGSRGDFDYICSIIVGELRAQYPNIKNTLVFSYIPTREYSLPSRYTDSVYLLEERVPYKAAILKTNEMVVDKCDFVIGFVYHSWGGAIKAIKYAERKKKITLNLAHYLIEKKCRDIHEWIEAQNPERKMKAVLRIMTYVQETEPQSD